MATSANPYRRLKKLGLVVTPALSLSDPVVVEFEGPARLGRGALSVRAPLKLGAYSFLRSGMLRHLESIGRYCSIGPNVTIGEAEHPSDWVSTSPAFYAAPTTFDFFPSRAGPTPKIRRTAENTSQPAGSVVIGNDVWIGANVIIRRGVRIGDGAIIGAGAVVLSDVEPYSIVGGVPAKPIRPRFAEDLVRRFQTVRWWEFDARALAGTPMDEPARALDMIADGEATGVLRRRPVKYRAVKLTARGFDLGASPEVESAPA